MRVMPIVASAAFIVAFIGISIALAAPDCATSYCVYVPAVQYDPPPTPVPTPIPPPLSGLALQPSEIGSDYFRDTNTEVTNDTAAANYPNPVEALKAFESQGRETAWFVRYVSTDNSLSTLVVGDETYRYLTTTGATQGQAYVIAKMRKDNPTFQPFTLTIPGYPSINLRRTFKDSNGTELVILYVSVQVGRYVTDIQVGQLADFESAQIASNYAQRVIVRIANTPQL